MEDLPAQKDRAARNEAEFRRINEGLAAGLRDSGTHRAGFVCECSSMDCRRLVDMTMSEYRAVREDPMRFILVPGHQWAPVEDVVGEGDGFLVVEKHAEVRSIVDPA